MGPREKIPDEMRPKEENFPQRDLDTGLRRTWNHAGAPADGQLQAQ
jgi:hypothetical protein